VRILLIAPACPHPFGDTAAKWFDVLIRELVRRGHRVELLCITEEPDARVEQSRRALAGIEGPGTLNALFHRMAISRSSLGRRLHSARRPFSELEQADGVRQLIDERLAQGYDVVHVEQLWSGWLIDGVPRSLLNVHHLEVIDREHDDRRSWREQKTWWQMRRATAAILRRSANVRLFTDRLAIRAREYNATARHCVIPFALDSTNYEPVPTATEPVVGLIGSMHWQPSRSAAERLITRIWPSVRRAIPSARLLVAGWNVDRYLSAHAGSPGVELRANIAHPRDFFSQVGTMVYAPGRGSGMKIKVMEAMAYGVPVVTTAEGVEGLAAEPGIHARVAEDDAALAAHVIELISNRTTAARMSEAARALIVDRYNPSVVVDRVIKVYEDVVAAG